MTDEQFEKLIKAINKHSEAIRDLADAIANDEPLNYSIARGLDKIQEALNSVARGG